MLFGINMHDIYGQHNLHSIVVIYHIPQLWMSGFLQHMQIYLLMYKAHENKNMYKIHVQDTKHNQKSWGSGILSRHRRALIQTILRQIVMWALADRTKSFHKEANTHLGKTARADGITV